MTQSAKLQGEIEALRLRQDADIDYSDIPETDSSWFETAELALGLTPGQN